MNRSYAELADIFAGMASAKQTWLREHGPKRGEMDTLQQEIQMEACAQVAAWLRRAAERKETA